MPGDHKEDFKKWDYSQLSISRVQFCSSSGYLLRSIIHAAVVVILGTYVTGIRSIHSMALAFLELFALIIGSC